MEKREQNAGTEDKGTAVNDNFEWSGRSQHLLFFFVYLMNYSIVGCIITKEKNHKETFIIPFLIMTIIIGNPVLLFQNSVGQYTRSGCLIIGEMFPVLYGLGFSMLLLSFVELIVHYFYITKIFHYLVATTINYPLPWMTCYSVYYELFPGCISKKDIDLCSTHEYSEKPCFDPSKRILAGEIYKVLLTFGSLKYSGNKWHVSRSALILVISILLRILILIFLLVGSNKTMKNFYSSLRIGMIFCLLLLFTTLVVVFIQPGVLKGIEAFYEQLMHPHMLEYWTWTCTLRKLIKSLRLAEGGHILFGSYMSRSNPDYWRSIILIISYTAMCTGAILYYKFFLGLFVYKLGMDVSDLISKTEENEVFIIFPTFLGILPSSSLFCFLFFVVLFLVSYFSMVVKVMVIERTIATYYNTSNYFIYVRFSICTVAAVFSIFFEKSVILEKYSNHSMLFDVCSVISVGLQQIMLLLYGVESMSDDIEYMMRVKVKLFIKFNWFLTPIICIITALVEGQKIDFKEEMMLKVMVISVLSIPVLLGFLYKLFMFTKKKDLIGILRHTDRYGPPSVEERIMRVLYNPKLTVRYRRRAEICTHECLLNCNALKTAIEEEISQTSRFTEELKLKAIDKPLEDKIILQFEKHRKYLKRALQTSGQSSELTNNLW